MERIIPRVNADWKAPTRIPYNSDLEIADKSPKTFSAKNILRAMVTFLELAELTMYNIMVAYRATPIKAAISEAWWKDSWPAAGLVTNGPLLSEMEAPIRVSIKVIDAYAYIQRCFCAIAFIVIPIPNNI